MADLAKTTMIEVRTPYSYDLIQTLPCASPPRPSQPSTSRTHRSRLTSRSTDGSKSYSRWPGESPQQGTSSPSSWQSRPASRFGPVRKRLNERPPPPYGSFKASWQH